MVRQRGHNIPICCDGRAPSCSLPSKLNVLMPFKIHIFSRCYWTNNQSVCMKMFITALFAIRKTGKWPGCPVLREWFSKVLRIQTLGHYVVLVIYMEMRLQ